MLPFWRAVAYGVVLAVVWVLLAWFHDAAYHLAPLLVAAVVPLGVAVAARPPRPAIRLAAAGAGAFLALAATLILALAGRLHGGSLLPTGGVAAEAVAFSLAGALIGLVLAMARGGDE
jgi:hypothetical protein